MSSDFNAREPHQPSMAGQIFKLQRNASRRLALQFLCSLDTREVALQAYEQELAKFPERIEEAKVAQEKAAQLPPPVDEEGNPMPLAQPTALLSDQLAIQQERLAEFVAQERQEPVLLSEELQEAFFQLAEELWTESVPTLTGADLALSGKGLHHILRKGWARARKIVAYAIEHRDEIDHLISQAADNWRLERMSSVDRNILRVASSELGSDPAVTPAIVINEAIEMAKAYGLKDSWRFVNGVLDRIRQILAATPLVFGDTNSASSPSK